MDPAGYNSCNAALEEFPGVGTCEGPLVVPFVGATAAAATSATAAVPAGACVPFTIAMLCWP